MEVDKIAEKIRGISWSEFDLELDLFVDKYQLDVEAEKMPLLVAKWGIALAEAQEIRDKAKEKVQFVDAQLFERAYEEKDGKTTDAAIKAWVKCHPEHVQASKAYIRAETAVNYMWSAQKSMEAKRESISEESKLWSKNYFARPNIPRDAIDKADQDLKERANEEVDKALSDRGISKPKRKQL